MYEEYYGFSEKPFSLTPDPKFLYLSESHRSAFELLQYAIRRREGFVVVTGDIGTGKTTLCRAILGQLDQHTFTALVLNPFLSEEDLITLILQDFGVVSREEVKKGRLAGVSKQELIDTLNEFLLSLLPIGGRAIVIVDEAQNLPPQVLEQIRILSNLETDTEKLLQVVLVGQLNLQTQLRAPEMRQLDQRISIRYQLNPLTREETAGYVAHRMQVAGGRGSVSFSPKAVNLVHRFSGGIPRLINLLCDRALLGGYASRMSRIPPEAIVKAAETLDLRPRGGWMARVRRRAGALLAGTVASVLLGATAASLVGELGWRPPSVLAAFGRHSTAPVRRDLAILVGSFEEAASAALVRQQLESLGYRVDQVEVEAAGKSMQQVLVGGFADDAQARAEAVRLQALPGFEAARLLRMARERPFDVAHDRSFDLAQDGRRP